MATTKDLKSHVIILSSPGMGHLIPNLELGKQLVTIHSFQVTIFVVASTSPAETQTIKSAMQQKLFEVFELPPVDISRMIGPETAIVTQLCIMMRHVKPVLRSAILDLNVSPDALIVDTFGAESLVVAKELGILGYVFIASNLSLLSLTIYLPVLDEEIEGEYVDQKEALKIPGCLPVRPEDVFEPMLDRTDKQYSEYLRIAAEIPTGDGILVNTWEELESATLAAFRDDKLLGQRLKVPIFPIGPFIRRVTSTGSNAELFGWLDKQQKESVVYVSFGSGGTLSLEQMNEIAWGLELSEQKFIWVVRPPTMKTREVSFFTVGKCCDDPSTYLPDGFLNRTQNVGKMVLGWAPQIDILSHPSVGGFLSHCGWNSTLESIINEVPMVAWPLYAEQRLNATLLTEVLEVAVRPHILPSKEVVRREEIASMVRRIMVDGGEAKIRGRVKELKQSAEEALSEGGTSSEALSLVANEILHHAKVRGKHIMANEINSNTQLYAGN